MTLCSWKMSGESQLPLLQKIFMVSEASAKASLGEKIIFQRILGSFFKVGKTTKPTFFCSIDFIVLQ